MFPKTAFFLYLWVVTLIFFETKVFILSTGVINFVVTVFSKEINNKYEMCSIFISGNLTSIRLKEGRGEQITHYTSWLITLTFTLYRTVLNIFSRNMKTAVDNSQECGRKSKLGIIVLWCPQMSLLWLSVTVWAHNFFWTIYILLISNFLCYSAPVNFGFTSLGSPASRWLFSNKY